MLAFFGVPLLIEAYSNNSSGEQFERQYASKKPVQGFNLPQNTSNMHFR